jgi:hypothetical protein
MEHENVGSISAKAVGLYRCRKISSMSPFGGEENKCPMSQICGR